MVAAKQSTPKEARGPLVMRGGSPINQTCPEALDPVALDDQDPEPNDEDHFGLTTNLVRALNIQLDRTSCVWVPNIPTGLGTIDRLDSQGTSFVSLVRS